MFDYRLLLLHVIVNKVFSFLLNNITCLFDLINLQSEARWLIRYRRQLFRHLIALADTFLGLREYNTRIDGFFRWLWLQYCNATSLGGALSLHFTCHALSCIICCLSTPRTLLAGFKLFYLQFFALVFELR